MTKPNGKQHIFRIDLVTVRDNFRGAGLLYYAAGRNLPRVIQILLESRADVDARDATKYMRTALWETAILKRFLFLKTTPALESLIS